MTKIGKKYLVIGAVALAFVLTATTYIGAQVSLMDTLADKIVNRIFGTEVSDSYVAQVDEAFGALPGPDIYNHVTLNEGYEYTPRYRATTTSTNATAGTMQASLLTEYEYLLVNLGGAVNTSYTWTLPASTTLSTFLNAPGASKEVCFFQNASTTSAGQELIFVAGTGIDMRMENATTTSAALAVKESGEACIFFKRQPQQSGAAGSFSALLRVGIDVD